MNPRVWVPDDTLLRRFGWVRAVGGAAYFVAVAVLFAVYGADTWPLVLGVPVLAVVYTVYFTRSYRYPRTSVAASLVADALVLGGAAAFIGGSGSGTGALYVIVITSAGIILGPTASWAFTALGIALSWLQVVAEEAGIEPALLFRPDLQDRIVVTSIMSTILVSVGFLTSSYAGRLHSGLLEAGRYAETISRRDRRRRHFVEQAAVDVSEPLAAIEDVAERLGDPDVDLETRERLAAQLRMRALELESGIAQLADVGVLDDVRAGKPEPVRLTTVISDCLIELGDRLAPYLVEVDVEPLVVAGNRRAARRIVVNLLENVCDHTPPGTHVWITTATTLSQGVLIVSDDGPGVPAEAVPGLFDPPEDLPVSAPRVGLPLVADLADAMGAEVRYEAREAGGSRFLVGFRLAPRDAAPEPAAPT